MESPELHGFAFPNLHREPGAKGQRPAEALVLDLYYQLREAMLFFQGIAADKATTMGHMKREHLSQAEVAFPLEPIRRAAGHLMELPQVMSGELPLDFEVLAHGEV